VKNRCISPLIDLMQVVGIQPAQIATANVFVKRTTVSAAVIEKEWMLMSHDGQLKRERKIQVNKWSYNVHKCYHSKA